MQQTREFRFASAGAARVILVAVSAAASALACSSDHALGNLAPDDLLDRPAGDSPGTAAVRPDLTVSSVLAPPEVSMDARMEGFPSLQMATGLGDVDGDGFGDFAASGYDASSNNFYVHLRYGGPRPRDEHGGFALAESGARLISGATRQLAMIEPIAALGDIDGDGFADFMVGWGPCPPERTPRVFLVYGGAERLDGVRSLEDAGVYLQSPSASESANDYCSGGGVETYFAGLGDFDGDGFDDFILSERPENDADTDSVANLFYGGAERIPTGTPWRDADAQLTSRDDLALRPLRDVNGDGLGDVVLGGRSVLSADEPPSRFFWLPGRTERLSGSVEVAAVGTPINAASAAGDLDGDGIHEVLLHDLDRGPHLFYGAPGLFDAGADLSQAAATFDAYAPQPDADGFDLLRLTKAGDRDGDGDDELAVGVTVAPLDHPSAFEVALVSGSRQRSSRSVAFHDPGPPSFADHWAVLEALFPVGDLDGDGATELVSVSRSYTALDNGAKLPTREELHIHYGTPGGHSSSPPR